MAFDLVMRTGDCRVERDSVDNVAVRTDVLVIYSMTYCLCGPGSSVSIATDYGRDIPGSNPSGDEIFRPSRPTLGPTQPPVQWVPALSRG